MARNPSKPSVTIMMAAPPNSRPGVADLSDQCVELCNAMITLDHAIDRQEDDWIITGKMKHCEAIVDTIGPIMAELPDPLEVVAWAFYRINQSVVESHMSHARMAMGVGDTNTAAMMVMQQDHIIAIVTQAQAELVAKHLETIKWSPNVAEDEGKGDTDE